MTLSSPDSLFRKTSFIAILYIVASMYVFGVWVWSADSPTTAFNSDLRSTLSELIYGTAHKPYVQRVLVPMLTRAVYFTVSGPTLDSLEQKVLELPKVQKETARLGWEIEYFAEYLIALSFAFLALFGFPFVMKNLWSTLYETEQAITNIIPILALLALPPVFLTGPHYIYDLPALFFFTLGMVMMIHGRWTFYYPVFILGCLNKETMVLLSLFFVLLYWKRMPRKSLLLHALTQGVIFAVIKAVITYSFVGNGGAVMDFHLFLNLHILLMGYDWTTLVGWTLVLTLVFLDFRKKHEILRKAILLAIPLGVLVLLSGVITELRAAYEMYPIVLLLASHTVLFRFVKIPYHLKQQPLLAAKQP